MLVVLLRTEGRGREAEVLVEGCRLVVVDRVSAADQPLRPGPIDGARLDVVTIPHLSGRAAGDEPGPKGLVREWGWRYRVRAEVLSVEPLRVDLGPFAIELELAIGETPAPGDQLSIAIDRILLSRSVVD